MPSREEAVRLAVAALVERDGQLVVAEAIGVNQSTVSRYLLGRQRLTFTLASGLGLAYPDLRPLLDRALYGHDADGDPLAAVAS